MKFNFTDPKENSQFQLSDFTCPIENSEMNQQSLYRIIWVLEGSVDFKVDTIPLTIKGNQLLFLTPHNHVEVPLEHTKLISLSFNREFYCIKGHDHEVSCHGYLFYGSATPPVVDLSEKEQQSLHALFNVFREEFEFRDHIQGEMLQMLLKRLLIKSVRLTRDLLTDPTINDANLDVVRQFNVLVEMHFKEMHQVKDYAELLFKSPKTLSNLFAQYNNQTPLQVINERIVLEAKRQLSHTNKGIEELAFELGYSDAAHFSKFFKKHTGKSPNAFKKEAISS